MRYKIAMDPLMGHRNTDNNRFFAKIKKRYK